MGSTDEFFSHAVIEHSAPAPDVTFAAGDCDRAQCSRAWRSPCAPKFAERTQDETLHPENHAKSGVHKLKKNNSTFSAFEDGSAPVPASKLPKEKEFVAMWKLLNKEVDLGEPTEISKDIVDTVYWVDINLAMKKGLKFYQIRSNAIILHETLPAYCIPKVVRMETGEIKNEKVYTSPRPPPKISLKQEWKRELGSEVAQRPEKQVVQQFKSFQSNQSIPNPDHDRTGQPVVGTDTRTVQDGRKRLVPRRSMLILFTKKLFLRKERRDPLLKRV